MASTKKPAKAKETEDTRETTSATKREVPKPRATRPKLRSSHGAQVPAKKTTRTASAKAAPAAAPKPRTTRAPMPTPKVASDAPPKSKRSRVTPPPAQGQGSLASDAAREVAVAIAVAALDKKAHALEILDVAGKVDYADFLVLMSGKSDRQVAALAQGIEEALRKKGKRALSVEGLPHAIWVLMDFGDVVVHVFQEDSRQLYDLDGLWMDAKRIPLPADA